MIWVFLLLLAWAVAVASGTRLCVAAVRAPVVGTDAGHGHELTLYEAAFLSGGPERVADLTMVSMARQRRLLLAHTGWATVVDPHGRDEMERSVIRAIGPGGQSRIAPVRTAAAAADAVRQLGDRLVDAGLAVPDAARTTVASGVREVRAAAGAVLALGAVALLTPADAAATDMSCALVALWFAQPLALTLSCLVIARIDVHPYSRWASPAGLRLLGALVREAGGTGGRDHDRSYLTSVAVLGIRAVGEPELRAAFAHREPYGRD
jgi:uncharacterized protein (TIGR04222 family)